MKGAKFTMATDSERFLLFDYYGLGQDVIDNVLNTYPRIRDMHSGTIFFVPIIIFVNTIASATNATILASVKGNWGKYGAVIPALQVFDSYERTVQYVWKRYREKQLETMRTGGSGNFLLPEFGQLEQVDFNFAYCDFVRTKQESVWAFSVFLESLDLQTWLCILGAFLLISVIISGESRNNWIEVVFLTMPPLMGQAVSGVETKLIGLSSILLLIWISSCVFLTNFYSGALTSTLISPAAPDSMTRIAELEQRNYTLVFDVQTSYDSLKTTVDSHLSSGIESEGTLTSLHRDMLTLKSLLNKSKIIPKDEFISSFVSGKKYAIVIGWPFCLMAATESFQKIQLEQEVKRTLRRRTCYVGKHMVPSGGYYYGFLPPGNYRKFFKVFRSLEEAGITSMFGNEVFALAYSRRVQDRVQVKSPTYVEFSGGSDVVTVLKMQGKILTVFLLWTLCLGLASIIFLCEMVGFTIKLIYLEKIKFSMQDRLTTF